jgi:hypothetical protein
VTTSRLRPAALLGFALAASLAATSGWTLQEFSWSTWLAGLVYSWSCVLTGSAAVILTPRQRRPSYEAQLPWVGRLPAAAYLALLTVVAVALAGAALVAYTYVFAFYGLFLSFFAEMQPHALFGRNGFINSDFFTPVTYLALAFWPMAAGALIANGASLVRGDPWKRLVLPTSTEILRLHLFVLVMPVVTLAVWAVIGESYHTVTIVVLMGLFYLLPDPAPGSAPVYPAE